MSPLSAMTGDDTVNVIASAARSLTAPVIASVSKACQVSVDRGHIFFFPETCKRHPRAFHEVFRLLKERGHAFGSPNFTLCIGVDEAVRVFEPVYSPHSPAHDACQMRPNLVLRAI